jgi:lipoyl(octanoyl) transferase
MKNVVDLYDLGTIPYRPAWDLQKSLQKILIDQKKARRSNEEGSGEQNDILLFVEHPHVFTLGKSGKSSHLLRSIEELARYDAEYIEIDRGGDITYHGPGQIVGYPIIDLDRHFTDVHKYLRYLEEVIIRSCSDFGVKAGRIEGLTGVWAGNKKICAMGIRCSRWVTMHGFAMNINTDLSYFNHIIPCGISNREVTSLSRETETTMDTEEVKKSIRKHFEDIFDVQLKHNSQKPEPLQQISYL